MTSVAIIVNRHNLNSLGRFINANKYSDYFKVRQEGNTFILSGQKSTLEKVTCSIESAYSVEVSWES